MATKNDIRPGDVLLFHGKGFIPWAIRLFDGSDVNHAALATPSGKLVEAAGIGLQSADLAAAIDKAKYTKVRRLECDTAQPVLDRATTFVAGGNKYAYHQILLLVLLAMTRRIPAPQYAKKLLRSALDHAATGVGNLVPGGKERMICSEFVYRCFAEAVEGAENPFMLAIDLVSVFADGEGENEGTFLDWGMAQQDREIELPPLPTFDDEEDPGFGTLTGLDTAQAEIDLLIIDYAEKAGLAHQLPDEPVPVSTTFAEGVADEIPEPTDEELLASMTAFGIALQDTAAGGVAPTFDGGIGGAIAAAALHGALQGIKDVSVDANFVTPRDLLKCATLEDVGQVD